MADAGGGTTSTSRARDSGDRFGPSPPTEPLAPTPSPAAAAAAATAGGVGVGDDPDPSPHSGDSCGASPSRAGAAPPPSPPARGCAGTAPGGAAAAPGNATGVDLKPGVILFSASSAKLKLWECRGGRVRQRWWWW